MSYPPLPRESKDILLDIHSLFLYLERLRQSSFNEISSIVGQQIGITFNDTNTIDVTINPITRIVTIDVRNIGTPQLLNGGVTYGKLQNASSTSKLIGSSSSSNSIGEISLGTGLQMVGTILRSTADADFDKILIDSSGNIISNNSGNVVIQG